MSEKELDDLRKQLELKQNALDLIVAVDYIRDHMPDPPAMLSGLATLFADQFHADLCLLCLINRDTGQLELKASNDRGKQFDRLTAAIDRELAERVLAADGVVIWAGDEVPAALRQTGLGDLQIAAVPIIMNTNERLGALLLARADKPFNRYEVELLKIAEDQIDSAVVQCYAYYDLQQRNRELETIYRIDHVRDQHLPFDEMLNAILHELRSVIQAEVGFIMLYSQSDYRLELRAATHDDLFRIAPYYNKLDQVANQALRQAASVCRNDLDEHELRSVMCIPLILDNEIIGVLGVVNAYRPGGFSTADSRLLSAIGSQMDTAIFESLEQRRLRQVLGRSVDPRVMQQLLSNPDVDVLKSERQVLSVLYSDIRGSTSLAERTAPEPLVGFINDYLGRMTDVILSHEGTLDKFVGDEVMALFGAPFAQPDHALRAVRVGLEMQNAHRDVMAIWRERGVESAPIGIGIATGELTVGEMGCAQRTDYTVLGRAANLGARICSVTQAGQVFISQATYDMVKGQVQAMPITGLQLKGVGHNVTVYDVTGLK